MKIYFVGILMVASLLCCKKKPIYTPVNGYLKSTFYYKKGSYWVYSDSISGREDSFVVTQTGDYDLIENEFGDREEVISLTMNRYDDITNIKYPEKYKIGLNKNTFSISFYNAYFDYNVNASYNLFEIVENYKISPKSTTNYDVGELLNVFYDLSLYGNVYKEVYVFHNYNVSGIAIDHDDVIYFDRLAGVMKMDIKHVKDTLIKKWELKRYKTII